MKIAILDLTKHPEPLMTGLQRAGASILDWLAPSFEGAEFKIFDIAEGNDPVPTPEAFDGLIVSGSELGVYDAVPWMPSVRDLLIDTKLTGKPIFGICFGHQIMADVFEGKAKKTNSGNVVGVREYIDENGYRFSAYAWHQDQVTVLPPEATVIAKAQYCPMAGLRYNFPAYSVQYHPEFTKSSISSLLDRGRNHFLDAKTADEALQDIALNSVSNTLDRDKVTVFFQDYGR